MKAHIKSDLLLNIFLPLICGALIYLFTGLIPAGKWLRNYLPDGLWAYAFASAILIAWQRKLNLLWLILMLMAGIGFEYLQFKGFMPGTGDLIDAFVYLAFYFIALLLNPVFKQTLAYQNS